MPQTSGYEKIIINTPLGPQKIEVQSGLDDSTLDQVALEVIQDTINKHDAISLVTGPRALPGEQPASNDGFFSKAAGLKTARLEDVQPLTGQKLVDKILSAPERAQSATEKFLSEGTFVPKKGQDLAGDLASSITSLASTPLAALEGVPDYIKTIINTPKDTLKKLGTDTLQLIDHNIRMLLDPKYEGRPTNEDYKSKPFTSLLRAAEPTLTALGVAAPFKGAPPASGAEALAEMSSRTAIEDAMGLDKTLETKRLPQYTDEVRPGVRVVEGTPPQASVDPNIARETLTQPFEESSLARPQTTVQSPEGPSGFTTTVPNIERRATEFPTQYSAKITDQGRVVRDIGDVDPILSYVDNELGMKDIKVKELPLANSFDIPALTGNKVEPPPQAGKVAIRLTNDKLEVPDLQKTVEEYAFGKHDPVSETGTRRPGGLERATDALSQLINKKLVESKQSGGLGRFVDFFSKRLGRTPEELQKLQQLKGGQNYAKELASGIVDNMNAGLEDANKMNIMSALRGEKTTNQLTALERQKFKVAREANDYVHELNYGPNGIMAEMQRKRFEIGDINKETFDRNMAQIDSIYQANKGKYVANTYDVFEFPENFNNVFNKKISKLDSGMYKARNTKLSQEFKDIHLINDPGYVTGKRILQTNYNKELMNYHNFIIDHEALWSKEPKRGYIEIPDTINNGIIAGKFVRADIARDLMGFTFENATLDKSFFLFKMLDKFRGPVKGAMTAYNPGVIASNISGDKLFSWAGGLPQLVIPNNKWVKFGEEQAKIKGSYWKELLKEGVIGTDITKADLVAETGLLVGSDAVSLNVKTPGLKGALKDTHRKVTSFYGGIDDSYKIGAYKLFLEQGFSKADALFKVKKMYQDYSLVAPMWDVYSKVPFFGPSFAKFTPEMLRIFSNAVKSTPMWTASIFGTHYLLRELGSKLSGETPEQRRIREADPSSGKVFGYATPIMTPWGEIDPKRWLAISQLTSSNMGLGSKNTLSQMGVPDVLNPTNTSNDILLSPLLGMSRNEGRFNNPIADPTYEQGMDKAKAFFKYAAESYLPAIAKPSTVSKLASAFTTEEGGLNTEPFTAGKVDMSGKQRSPAQVVSEVFAGLRFRELDSKQMKELENRIATSVLSDLAKRQDSLMRLAYRNDLNEDQKIDFINKSPKIAYDHISNLFPNIPELANMAQAAVQSYADNAKLKLTEFRIIPKNEDLTTDGKLDKSKIAEVVDKLKSEINASPKDATKLADRTLKTIQGQAKGLKFFETNFDNILKTSDAKALYLLTEIKGKSPEDRRAFLKAFQQKNIMTDDQFDSVIESMAMRDPNFLK